MDANKIEAIRETAIAVRHAPAPVVSNIHSQDSPVVMSAADPDWVAAR